MGVSAGLPFELTRRGRAVGARQAGDTLHLVLRLRGKRGGRLDGMQLEAGHGPAAAILQPLATELGFRRAPYPVFGARVGDGVLRVEVRDVPSSSQKLTALMDWAGDVADALDDRAARLLPELLTLAGAGSADEAIAAVELCERWYDDTSAPTESLAAARQHPEARVRLYAAQRGGESGLPLLRELALGDDPAVSLSALNILTARGPGLETTALLRRLVAVDKAERQRIALQHLVAWRVLTPDDEPDLLRALTATDRDTRIACIAGLRAIGGRESAPPLQALAASGEDEEAAAALLAAEAIASRLRSGGGRAGGLMLADSPAGGALSQADAAGTLSAPVPEDPEPG